MNFILGFKISLGAATRALAGGTASHVGQWIARPLLVLALAATPALAETRVALVIGNAAYKHAPALANPKNDAEAMAASLRRLKFEVLAGTDLDKAAMDKLLRAFAGKLETADVALVFYAGHGLQVHGRNYLVPVDGKLDKESDLGFEAVSLDFIQQLMEQQRRTSIMILDACRDNPLARNLARTMGTRSTGIGRGLAQTQSGLGTLIVYATQPGNVALDGPDGGNSPFTGALLKHMETPGLEIRQVLTRVRQGVIQATREKQVPWDSSSLTGDFYFAAAPAARETPPPPAETKPPAATPPAATDTPQPRGPAPDQETVFWQSIQNSKNAADYKAYLEKYPNGTFAALAKIRLAEIEKAAAVTPPAPEKPVKPTPQPSPPRRTSSFENGVVLKGDYLFGSNVDSANACQALCLKHVDCVGWYWIPPTDSMMARHCAQMKTITGKNKDKTAVAGVIRTAPAASPAQPAAPKPQPGAAPAAPAQPAKPQSAVLPAPGDEQGLIREVMRRAQAMEPENGLCARARKWAWIGHGGYNDADSAAAFRRLVAQVPVSGGTFGYTAKVGCAFVRVSAERLEGGRRCRGIDTWICSIGNTCSIGATAPRSSMCELASGRWDWSHEKP
jgi:uncharacterized caspase-like protein